MPFRFPSHPLPTPASPVEAPQSSPFPSLPPLPATHHARPQRLSRDDFVLQETWSACCGDNDRRMLLCRLSPLWLLGEMLVGVVWKRRERKLGDVCVWARSLGEFIECVGTSAHQDCGFDEAHFGYLGLELGLEALEV